MKNRDKWVTSANILSASRFMWALGTVYSILTGMFYVAAGLFVVACLSDLIDGPIARRRGEASRLGGKLDHAADAFYVTTGIASLSALGSVTTLLAPLIFFAFLEYILDSYRSESGQLRPSQLGKWNGIGYFILLGFGIGQEVLFFNIPFLHTLTYTCSWLLVVTTVASIVIRLKQRRSKEGTKRWLDER